MQYLQYLIWLAEQAMSALFYFWPVTLALVIPFIITLALKSPFMGSEPKFCRRHLSVFLPLAVTLLILVWGTVMEHPSDSQSLAPSWPSYVVDALLIIQLLVSIWVVWFMKGYRWFSVFTVVLEQWFALACAFVAGMSVTGDWL
jgi:hypothetical protein